MYFIIEETDFHIEGRLFFCLANYEKKEQNKKGPSLYMGK